MANECIIYEYSEQIYQSRGLLAGAGMPYLITSQFVSPGNLSAKLDARTAYVVVESNGAGFWVKPGDSSASAVANTAGNILVQSGGIKEIAVLKDGLQLFTYIDTAAL